MNIKPKSEKKIRTNEFRYFLESNFIGVNKLFVLVCSNHENNATNFKVERYYLPKGIIKNDNVIINVKQIYDHAIDSDIKCYVEIRKLTTGQGEDYTTGCLLGYDYMKSLYRLIPIDLSR